MSDIYNHSLVYYFKRVVSLGECNITTPRPMFLWNLTYFLICSFSLRYNSVLLFNPDELWYASMSLLTEPSKSSLSRHAVMLALVFWNSCLKHNIVTEIILTISKIHSLQFDIEWSGSEAMDANHCNVSWNTDNALPSSPNQKHSQHYEKIQLTLSSSIQ